MQTPKGLDWTANFIHHVFDQHGAGNGRSGAVARWLADMLAKGALTAESTLQSAWERLSAKLSEWVIYTPVESRDAVVELATARVLGEGLLPIPIGRRTRNDPLRDQDKLDTALRVLGEGNDNTQRSRLLLAEDLLSVRDGRELTDDLARLPLLRAHRFPDDQDDAWSVNDMRRAIERHRVFARNRDDQARQAVISVANALDEACWLVGPVPASLAEVPGATTSALADAVLAADTIRSNPNQRIGLLHRLAEDHDRHTRVAHCALRVLLTGEPAAGAEGARDRNLYYVRDDDGERDLNRTTLKILLRLRAEKWREVPPDLVARLRTDLVNDLRVNAADTPGALQGLLDETLTTDAGWDQLLRDEVLHLLKRLHGVKREDRQRWRDMPLHRDVDGIRGRIEDRALVAGEMDLPDELRKENVRLLKPDPEVINLYSDIQSLNREGILCTMLRDERPHRFVKYILDDLTGRETLPDNTELLELLTNSPWLPTCDGESSLAPAQLIYLSEDLLHTVQTLATALREYRLPDAVLPEIWDRAQRVVHEFLGRPNRRRQLQRFAGALDTTRVANVDGGAFLILPLDDQVDHNLIQVALETPLVDSHRGWKIVQAAAAIVGRRDSAVIEIARAVRGPIPARYQVAMLQALANSRRESPAGKMYRYLLPSFANTEGFFEHVLPCIKVPTQDGHWRIPMEVARSPFGVARRHRIVEELHHIWRLSTDDRVDRGTTRGTENLGVRRSESVLSPYFKQWENRLNHSAVGAFLSLLGDGHNGRTLTLAQRWLGDDLDVADVRRLLSPPDQGRCGQVRVFVDNRIATGDRVNAVNLLGQTVEMHAGLDNETIFAKEPHLGRSVLGDYWIFQLRSVTPEQRTERELVEYLQNTVEWWADRVLRIERPTVHRWWNRWRTGEQVEVAPVRAWILADLPLTLQHLGVHDRQQSVHDHPRLQAALANAKRARQKRVQAETTEATEDQRAIWTERDMLKRLGERIAETEHSVFLRGRVREAMERSGYTAESVLPELVQNADDALAQAAEIAGGQLPQAVRRAMIRVDGNSTIDFIHYGRPINDTGGALFPAGRDRHWDQDLYFMMLLNLTAKSGETPQEDAEPSTTGRFGLGFKSIHLISDSPSVVSGFIAFKIAAGLLPEPIPHDPLEPIEGHLATRIRLPLHTDADILKRTFYRFHPIFPLLPAFARELREIVVEGGPYAGVGTFDGDPIADTRWSINKETTELPGHGTWRLLRFRPGSGTAALVVGLRDGTPEPLPPEVPFLWNVAPTDEWRGCGYAVNGPFKLDPGRTHISLGHQDTLLVVKQLGTALGSGLVALHDALANNSDRKYDLPVGCEEVAHFTAALWKVLASGIDDRDKLRCEFLRQLHGSRRGISAWMCARSVVPTEVPAPFRDRLAPLSADTPIERAEGGLVTAPLCDALARIREMVPLAQDRPAVSGSIAHVLQSLGMRWSRLLPSDLFKTLAKPWKNLLTPERLHALRPLTQDTVWELVADPPAWYSNFVAYSVAGEPAALDHLLIPSEMNDAYVDSSAEEELRRAKFAPETAVLGEGYIRRSEDVTMFRRLRTRHNINAETIAAWFTDLDTDRQSSALRYLLHGDLQNTLLQALRSRRPNWLAKYNVVRDILYSLNEDSWRCEMLLAALFPERYQTPDGESVVVDRCYSDETKVTFFFRFGKWWNNDDNRERVIEKYERDSWPEWLRADGIEEGLRANDDQHWLALMVLGICRGLGRTHDSQHRDFLTLARDNGWWDVFMNPDDADAWMEVLRTWHDRTVDRLEYALWISMVPRIYQCSHYLSTYRDLLLRADRITNELHEVKNLLAPRSNPRLTGAGVRYDAPPAPLDMGFHWVLRELVRLGIIADTQTTDRQPHANLLRACWVPSSKVLEFLNRLGLQPSPAGSSNAAKAASISDFIAEKMNTKNPHLDRSFDIPLRHVASDSDLQRDLGLGD